MNPDYQKLLQRVEALEKWKAQKTAQQIAYPLDIQSQTILQKYFMSISDIYNYILYGASDHATSAYIGKQGNLAFQITPQTLFKYTVIPSTDVFTVIGTRFVNDEAVLVTTDDTLPAPLIGTTTYYVISASNQTFKLSLTVGGAAVNITTAGTGSQFIYREL